MKKIFQYKIYFYNFKYLLYKYIYLQSDPKVVQLLGDLRAELRLAANARPGGQLDPHLPILNPPLLGLWYEIALYFSHYYCRSHIFLQIRMRRTGRVTSTRTRCTPATMPSVPMGGGRSWPPPAFGMLCRHSYRTTVWITSTIPPALPPRSADYRQVNHLCSQTWRRIFFSALDFLAAIRVQLVMICAKSPCGTRSAYVRAKSEGMRKREKSI